MGQTVDPEQMAAVRPETFAVQVITDGFFPDPVCVHFKHDLDDFRPDRLDHQCSFLGSVPDRQASVAFAVQCVFFQAPLGRSSQVLRVVLGKTFHD
nr:hypothetical protein [Dubosiella newyorkensis]